MNLSSGDTKSLVCIFIAMKTVLGGPLMQTHHVSAPPEEFLYSGILLSNWYILHDIVKYITSFPLIQLVKMGLPAAISRWHQSSVAVRCRGPIWDGDRKCSFILELLHYKPFCLLTPKCNYLWSSASMKYHDTQIIWLSSTQTDKSYKYC